MGRRLEVVVHRQERAVARHEGIGWLPPGSSVESWIGDHRLDPILCSASFAFLFGRDGRMLLANVLKRGADIPGGRIEPGETVEETAVRESVEETGARVRLLGRAGHLRVLVPNPPPGFRYPTPEGFQTFYAAEIESIGPVGMPQECGEPIWVDPREAADDPRFRLHRDLILAAFEMWKSLRSPEAPGEGHDGTAQAPAPF